MYITTKGFFDSIEKELFESVKTGFPKYDIIRDGEKYKIVVALAGFKKDEISLELKDDPSVNRKILKLSSSFDLEKSVEESQKVQVEYLHRGIARRDFSNNFYLSRDSVIDSAKFEDGLLTIEISVVIPEEKKPKLIEIA